MPIAVSYQENTGILSGNTYTSVATHNPAADELWRVFLVMRTTSITPSIVGTGLTWTLLASVVNVQNQIRGFLWQGLSHTDPASGQIVITMTGNLKPAQAFIYKVTGMETGGVNGADSTETVVIENGPAIDDQDMFVPVTTLTKNVVVIGHGSHRGNAFDLPAGETLISSDGGGSGGDRITATGWRELVPVPATVNIGEPGDLVNPSDWILIATAIKLPITAEASDTVTVTEEVSATVEVAPVDVSDGIAVAEEVVAALANNADINDLITVSETIDVELVYLIDVSDQIDVSEEVAAYPDLLFLAESDLITVAEEVQVLVATPLFVSENITVSEVIAISITLEISVVEEISVAENIQFGFALLVNVSESITVSESVGLTFAHLISVSENISISEVIIAERIFVISVFEVISVTETAIAGFIAELFVSVLDSIFVREEVRFLGRRRRVRRCYGNPLPLEPIDPPVLPTSMLDFRFASNAVNFVLKFW